MTAKTRQQAINEDRCLRRRETILAAAVAAFAEAGYADADMQALADRLQVGKGTIYRYFPSKQELFLCAVDRGMRLLRQRVDAAIEGVEDPFERIANAIRAYLAFFAENAEYVELLIQERAQFKNRKKPTYFEHREVNIERWRTLYRELIAAGRFRNVPVERILTVIGDLLYGTMFTNYFTGQRKPLDEQANDIIDIVFNGVLSDDERRHRKVG